MDALEGRYIFGEACRQATREDRSFEKRVGLYERGRDDSTGKTCRLLHVSDLFVCCHATNDFLLMQMGPSGSGKTTFLGAEPAQPSICVAHIATLQSLDRSTKEVTYSLCPQMSWRGARPQEASQAIFLLEAGYQLKRFCAATQAMLSNLVCNFLSKSPVSISAIENVSVNLSESLR